MRILITGKSKLSRYLGDAFIARTGQPVLITHCRFEDEIDWDRHDIFINCAHREWEQSKMLLRAYEAWRYEPTKTIINISSRAVQPNISKGYLYAAQKSSLTHLSNNLVYNSDKKCRVSTIHLGLLERNLKGDPVSLPCLTYNDVYEFVSMIALRKDDVEIPEITIQHRANYREVQDEKELLEEGFLVDDWLGVDPPKTLN
tara:strand:- start:1081 stop:1683 length:603 start_codon:yes stop_codon:yes gene_type:complete